MKIELPARSTNNVAVMVGRFGKGNQLACRSTVDAVLKEYNETLYGVKVSSSVVWRDCVQWLKENCPNEFVDDFERILGVTHEADEEMMRDYENKYASFLFREDLFSWNSMLHAHRNEDVVQEIVGVLGKHVERMKSDAMNVSEEQVRGFKLKSFEMILNDLQLVRSKLPFDCCTRTFVQDERVLDSGDSKITELINMNDAQLLTNCTKDLNDWKNMRESAFETKEGRLLFEIVGRIMMMLGGGILFIDFCLSFFL